MKKILFVLGMVLISVSVRAQFTIYQPVDVPHRSYTPSSGYGVPFTIYEPVERGIYSQTPKPRMQEMTLTGYYKNGNGWNSMPIRVGFVEDRVILLSVKQNGYWSNCGAVASEVGGFDSEEVRDNFTYKAYGLMVGTVYF